MLAYYIKLDWHGTQKYIPKKTQLELLKNSYFSSRISIWLLNEQTYRKLHFEFHIENNIRIFNVNKAIRGFRKILSHIFQKFGVCK